MNHYRYTGPVYEFDKCIVDHWESETIAPSKKKALSNFKHQFKVKTNRLPTAKITLTGNIEIF